jgi:hypothetical protein
LGGQAPHLAERDQGEVLTDTDGYLLFCGQAEPGSYADITQARRSGLVDLLNQGPPCRFLPMPTTKA